MVERAVRVVIGALLVLAGICYSSWLLEFVFDVGLDPIHSFLSELEAPDRPYRAWFEFGDVLTGSMSAAAALLGLVFLPPRRLFSTVGWAALAAFGASTYADSQSPVGCVPAPAHPCPDEPSGLLPQLHHLHALTSTLAVTSIFVTMIAFTLAARRNGRWPMLGTVGLGLLVVIVIATVWMGLSSILNQDWSLGVAQRIQIGGMSLWLGTLGVAVWREPVPVRVTV